MPKVRVWSSVLQNGTGCIKCRESEHERGTSERVLPTNYRKCEHDYFPRTLPPRTGYVQPDVARIHQDIPAVTTMIESPKTVKSLKIAS